MKINLTPETVRRVLEGNALRGDWTLTARNPDGSVKFTETYQNLVTDEGLNYLLDAALSGGTAVASWFLLLISGTPTVAGGDTLASNAWTEITAYNEASRPAWTDGGVSGQSVDNSASTATFTINANGTTIGGAGLASNATKGGTTGTLFSAGAFVAGDKSLDSGDTLDVTATFTAAAA